MISVIATKPNWDMLGLVEMKLNGEFVESVTLEDDDG